MKKTLFLFPLFTLVSLLINAQVANTSYLNDANEKVLQLSVEVPIDIKEAWSFFTQDAKLAKWIAPVAHIELKTGGYILTNYDKNKPLSDSNSIRLGIINYLQNELLVLKVKLNNNFPKKVREEDNNLQEIIQFISVEPGKTKIISSMVGWGEGKDWEKTYDFFLRGNEYTFRQFLKIFH